LKQVFQEDPMKSRHTFLFAVILALPVAAGGDRDQLASQPEPPAFLQGMILNIDSAGKFSHGAPQASDLRAAMGDALSTSSEGLIEVKSPVAGGGYTVELQGRFQNAMMIQVDQNGNATAPCLSGQPEDAQGEVE
jgi:hypothetical protein